MEEVPGALAVAPNVFVHPAHGRQKWMIDHHEEEEVKGAGVLVRVVLVCLRYSGRLPETNR
jgi:hypothetical protein